MKNTTGLILIFLSSLILAQVDSSEINDDFQSILEDASIDKEDFQIYDLIEELIIYPIDINSATIEQLLQIPYLNFLTANAIIRYRDLHGKFNSINELENIDELNDELINKITPFIQINKSEDILLTSMKRIFNKIKISNRFRTIQDIQTRKGFRENKFTGSKQKIYNRFLINSENNFRAGLTIEKDAGESSFSDFFSSHIQINNYSIFSNITFGDYIVEFGQGLALWGPYSFSKGIDAVNFVNKNGRTITPYISTDENKFFRGFAMNVNTNHLILSPFISSNKIDASIDSITHKVNSFDYDGYHRTKTEIDKKDKINENLYGMAIHFDINENNRIGLLYYHSKFSNELKYDSEKFYSSFDCYSLSYSSLIKKLNINGEFAYNKNSIASINTINLEAEKNLSLIFSHRYYPANFISLHGNSFGENPSVQNEIGFYTGILFRTKFGTFHFYYDQFHKPKASNTLSFSSNGYEFLIYYYYKIFQRTELRIKYKYQNKEIESNLNEVKSLINSITNNLRLEILFNSSQKLKLKTRLELISLSQLEKENGYLISEDINYSLHKNLYFYGRIIFFRTNSYNSRLYAYENDLPGIMSVPVLYGEGMRWFILIKYKTKFGIDFSFKYSELYKPDERTLGSSYNQIDGNLDNRISFQIDWRL
ncbi:MAG: helix-hairpin-helix domain-containing protein [Melioribacter sp.]|uniref:ComEA family DNA-binding protein n=1 Tax=Rosettibacter primus TaxID=3111523 RepID=UPI00247BEB7F|nr:helix-hairpin-helix domain-containing protein [Melioribacter sp.]